MQDILTFPRCALLIFYVILSPSGTKDATAFHGHGRQDCSRDRPGGVMGIIRTWKIGSRVTVGGLNRVAVTLLSDAHVAVHPKVSATEASVVMTVVGVVIVFQRLNARTTTVLIAILTPFRIVDFSVKMTGSVTHELPVMNGNAQAGGGTLFCA